MTTWTEPAGLLARGTIVVVPGRGENAEVYARLGRRLAADAYRVRVLDSTDDPALADVLADPDLVRPLVLLGSDTGADRAAREAASGAVDAIVLGGLPGPVTGTLASEPVAALAGWELELDARTSCPTHRGLLERDTGFVRGALADPVTEENLGPTLAAVTVPALAIHGDADRISAVATALPLYREVPDLRVKVLIDGRHDVFNDSTHRSVAATVVLFVEDLRLGHQALEDVPAP